MKTCKACGAEARPGLQFCPNCGGRLSGDLVLSKHKTTMLDQPELVGSGYLEFLGGPEDGRIIPLSGERVTVGRREDNDVHIYSDTALSRRHAFIYRREGQFWIEDRKSSFGTWVNGERVPVETAAPMPDGALIRLARTTLVFHLGEAQEVELREIAAQASMD